MKDRREIEKGWENEEQYCGVPPFARVIKTQYCGGFPVHIKFQIDTRAWTPDSLLTFDHATFQMFNWIPDEYVKNRPPIRIFGVTIPRLPAEVSLISGIVKFEFPWNTQRNEPFQRYYAATDPYKE